MFKTVRGAVNITYSRISYLTVLSIRYPPVVYVTGPSKSFKHKMSINSLLTAPITVLSTRCPSVVYVNSHFTVLNIRCPSVVYVSSPSHSFKHKVSIRSLC
jgi:hypothetical protein